MKRKVLALMVPALLMASAANAAEIYNKNGNKLDLYGKVDGLHYFSDDASEDGDQTYVRFGLKGETEDYFRVNRLRSVGIQHSGEHQRKRRRELLDPSRLCRPEVCRLRVAGLWPELRRGLRH